MDNTLTEWEDDGGSPAPLPERGMIGTLNQIAWAVQIKSQVNAEFDRVRKVLEHAMTKEAPSDVTDIQSIIRILEDKRAEVMGHEDAGYFIHDWRELGSQVSQIIIEDPRYQAIKARQTARFGLSDAHRPKRKEPEP